MKKYLVFLTVLTVLCCPLFAQDFDVEKAFGFKFSDDIESVKQGFLNMPGVEFNARSSTDTSLFFKGGYFFGFDVKSTLVTFTNNRVVALCFGIAKDNQISVMDLFNYFKIKMDSEYFTVNEQSKLNQWEWDYPNCEIHLDIYEGYNGPTITAVYINAESLTKKNNISKPAQYSLNSVFDVKDRFGFDLTANKEAVIKIIEKTNGIKYNESLSKPDQLVFHGGEYNEEKVQLIIVNYTNDKISSLTFCLEKNLYISIADRIQRIKNYLNDTYFVSVDQPKDYEYVWKFSNGKINLFLSSDNSTIYILHIFD